jgi:imidazolonepropionase-like amidohydrolase
MKALYQTRPCRFASPSLTICLAVALCVGPPDCVSAETPRIAGFTPQTIAITQAKLVTAPGQVIEGGTLIVRNGLIVDAGLDVSIPADAEILEADGLYVYAGFIDAAAVDLLDTSKKPTPSAGRKVDFSRYVLAATRPDNRDSMTPEFRVAEALKLEDAALDAIRKLGFTTVHILPTGRVASGQGAFISMSGSPPRESILVDRTFVGFQLFAPRTSNYPATLMGATAHLRQGFLDASRHTVHRELYLQDTPGVERPPIDPVLTVLGEILAKERRSIFHVTSRDDIHRALDFCAEHDISGVLWGAAQAHRCLDRLQAANVDVILDVNFGDRPKVEPNKASEKLSATVNDPLRVQQDRRDEWDRRAAGPAQLEAAGIRFALSSFGLKSRDELLKGMRQAIEAGLPRDAALAALTTNPASILGLENRLGTLTPGKLGHVVVMTGPFDNAKSKIRYLLVDGQKFEYNSAAKPLTDADTSAPAKEKTEPASPVKLAGQWQLAIESGEGAVTGTLELSQSGNRLNGTFHSEQGNGKLTSGTVQPQSEETEFNFVVAIGAGDRAVQLKFDGTAQGDKLAGTLKSAFGAPTKWSAVRTESKEKTPQPSVALSLDDSDPAAPPQPREVRTGDASAAKGETKTSDPAQTTDSPAELPTELESDRLQRQVRTGGNVLIKNGTVLTGTGRTLPETSILVRNGKIAGIGGELKPDDGMAVIDASGRFIIPGIIDTHSHIMINGGVNEATQSIVPEVRIKDAIETDDVGAYRALAGGTTTARIFHGSANVVGGQDAVVKLKYGAPASEQILHDAPQGVKFALGENVKFRTTRFPNTRMGVEATLNRAFLEAVDYRRQWMQYERAKAGYDGDSPKLLPPRRDLRLEALADIVNHQKFIHSHCYRADEILMLMRVASNLGIRIWSLQHVLEGYKVAPEIVAHGASCSTFADWWAYKVEAYDAVPHNAALLQEAGANVVIKSDDRELIRHLYLEAAKSVRYGNMHPDHALQAVTLNPARELGLNERIGSIEVGKDADLAIFSGHPFNVFSRCEQTLIDGEVYFTRADQPSAMSPAAVERSAKSGAFDLPTAEIRNGKLELTASAARRYAIVGATLHPVDAPPIEGGTLLIEDGRIAALGTDVELSSNVKTIDATGLHVYPGLIDAGTTLGLTEIGKVRETQDFSEGGNLQPDLRAGIAVNPDSELIPVARAGGITRILVRPTGGLIAGQVSLVQLAGWTADEMVRDYEAGLQINWPGGSSAKRQLEQLTEFLSEARLYDKLRSQADSLPDDQRPLLIADPRLEAMRPYLAGKKRVFIEADSRKAIAEALLFAEKEKLKIVIAGGTDAWKLADELKKRDVPVIVGPVMRSPVASYDPFDAPYANPGRLYEAGVKFCIRSDNASNSRNAPFEAAMAVAYGLPEDEALRSVTLSAAEILNIDERVGSLTVGKSADLLISDGSPLQITAQIKGVFVEGNPYPPESRQTRFYERYRQRLQEVRTQEAGQPREVGSRE